MTSMRAAFALFLTGAVGLACSSGSRPIPHFAMAGTSITIAVPKEIASGYGTQAASQPVPTSTAYVPDWTVPYQPGSRLEDEQRGDMLFYLFDDTGAEVTRLPVRLITRIEPSELTPEGMAGSVDINPTDGQTLAVLDIPVDVPAPADYTIGVRRAVRTAPGGDFQEGLEEWSWVDPIPQDWAGIRIMPGDGVEHYTPTIGINTESAWLPVHNTVKEFNPYPSVRIRVHQTGGQFGQDLAYAPAAYEFEMQYPRRQVEIVGVSLLRLNPSRAIATFEDLDGSVDCVSQPGQDTGTVRIAVADPEEMTRTLGVRVGFRRINFDQPCAEAVDASSFSIVPASFMHYELDGTPSTVSLTPLITEIS